MRDQLIKVVLALAVVTALVSGPWPGDSASASCVAPTLSIDGNDGFEGRPTLPTELDLTVDGTGFANGCNDTGTSSGFGCSANHGALATPMKDITLRLRQGGREWDLGVVDAGSAENNQLGQVTWTVTVPDDVKPGKARLVTDHSMPLKIKVVIPEEG